MILTTGFTVAAKAAYTEDYLADNGFVLINSRLKSNTLNSPKIYMNRNGDKIIRSANYDEEMYLNITRVQQADHNVCWAACAEMVAKYKTKTTYDQFDAIRYIKNSIKYETATLSETVRVIDYMCQTRFHAYVYPFQLTKADIYDEISNFRPIIMVSCIENPDKSRNCHMFLCTGYKMINRNNVNSISEVCLVDPNPNNPNPQPQWISYSNLIDTQNGFQFYDGSKFMKYESNILIQ